MMCVCITFIHFHEFENVIEISIHCPRSHGSLKIGLQIGDLFVLHFQFFPEDHHGTM